MRSPVRSRYSADLLLHLERHARDRVGVVDLRAGIEARAAM